MEDDMKTYAIWAGLGAALGLGVALGMGLKVLATGAVIGVGAGVALGAASTLAGRKLEHAGLVPAHEHPALH